MRRRVTRLVVIVAVSLLLLITATAFLVNLYRDSIAMEVARSALAGSGIEVIDVSVASISSSEVRFDAIVLGLEGGGTVHVEGTVLPVRLSGLRDNRLHIQSLRFEPGATESGPLRLAAMLQSMLDAPAKAPGLSVTVDELLLPGVPAVADLSWHADAMNPTVRASIGDFELFLTTTRLEDGTYRASLRALLPDDREAVLLAATIAPDDAGYALRGDVSLLLEPLLPALRALGAAPPEVTALASDLDGTFDVRLDADENRPAVVRAEFGTIAGTVLSYQADESSSYEVSVLESSPAGVTLSYPSFEWTAAVVSSSIAVAGTDPGLPPVHLEKTACRSGIHCVTGLSLSFSRVSLGEFAVDEVSVRAGSVRLDSAEDWRASSQDVQVVLGRPTLAGHRIVAPRIRADVSGSGERVSATVAFSTPENGLSGRAELVHELATATGRLTLPSAAVDFGALALSKLVTDWRQDFDVTSGRCTANAELRWTLGDAGPDYEGTASLAAESLAGRYGDVGFLGFESKLNAGLDSRSEMTLSPADFTIALVDIGFPVEDVSGSVVPHLEERAAEVSGLSMTLLGGQVTAEPFRYDFEADSNKLLLHASAIQLPLMAGLADLEAVTISGSVSGEIPVTIRGKNVIIDAGHLENDPPGGVIRYRGGAAASVVDDSSQLGIVTRTLRNFEFDSLTSAVNYSEDGDLVLKMRLKGINPDVDPLQPVILNLSVENNVPQMLRSLQATRSIEDVLERELSK